MPPKNIPGGEHVGRAAAPRVPPVDELGPVTEVPDLATAALCKGDDRTTAVAEKQHDASLEPSDGRAF